MKICKAILAMCILNFCAFSIGSVMIGGSAANGFIEDGAYFVSEHGTDTEVEKWVWNYSLWHFRSLLVSHPLAFIVIVILYGRIEDRKRRLVR